MKMLYIRKAYLSAELSSKPIPSEKWNNLIVWEVLDPFLQVSTVVVKCFWLLLCIILLIRERWMKAPSAMVLCRSCHYSFSALDMERMWCGVSHSSHNVICSSRWALFVPASGLAEVCPSHYNYCSEGDCSTPVGGQQKSTSKISEFALHIWLPSWLFSMCSKSCNSSNVKKTLHLD